ncbi:hypothetical protein UPYG_G00165230 [Umbra pygmaea]|uniref:Uncharacterized protein n=1 Tax=Umbra pygmaea TaxID=75934 RepID=A0ABD0X8G0_UMBPY
MAPRHLFFAILFLYTVYYIKAQGPPQPSLTVSPTVIRETDSVQLSCQTLPAVVQVTCNYTVGRSYSSPLSDPVFVTVQAHKPVISVHHDEEDVIIICEIPGPAGSDTTCNLYVGEQQFRKQKINRKKASTSKRFCQFTVNKDDLIGRLQLVRREEVSCDYTLSSGPNYLSTRSDGYNLIGHLGELIISVPTTKQTSSTTDQMGELIIIVPTTKQTSSTTVPGLTVGSILTTGTLKSSTERYYSSTGSVVNSNHKDSDLKKVLWYALVGGASGLSVFLLGLTAVCLCRKTRQKHSQRSEVQQECHNLNLEIEDMSSGGLEDSWDDEFYDIISTDPSTTVKLQGTEHSFGGPAGEKGQLSDNDNSDTDHIYLNT